jgi:putative dimethyl sulfoxide reductase chaperone
MNEEYRLYIYAFLSRAMSDIPDMHFIKDLRANRELLEIIGEESAAWFDENDDEALYDALNSDFTSLFIINTQPIESFVLDAKNESLVGLQNPVMAFYYNHGFEVDMNQTEIMAPDHLSIEFAFMQTLVYRDERAPQFEFLDTHLLPWAVPYMMGMKHMAETPFYRELCDFISEFLTADYAHMKEAGSYGA